MTNTTLTPPSSPKTSPRPLKHSIESLLSGSGPIKTPCRPSPRYTPYSSPFSYTTSYTPPASPPLSDLEQQLLLLKQLQQRIQLSDYISSLKQTPTNPQTLPSSPVNRPARRQRSAVVTKPTIPAAPPTISAAPPTLPDSEHSCTATTCTHPSCPHRITTPRHTTLPVPRRRGVRSAEQPPRPRTHLTCSQRDALQLCFAQNSYLTRTRRRELSEETGLREETVSVWFQNRRRQEKKKTANTLQRQSSWDR